MVDLKALAERAAVQKARQPVFDRWPPIVDLDFAMKVALGIVEEWEYSDPHGWCHDRPIYLTLASAVLDLMADRDRLKGRIEKAKALHHVNWQGSSCAHCGFLWPCHTAEALGLDET